LPIDHEPEMIPFTTSKNTASVKSNKIDLCHLFLTFFAFYLMVMLIFSPSTIVNHIRKTNYFQATYNFIETFTGATTNDEIKALTELGFRKYEDEILKLKADIAARQYALDKLKKGIDKRSVVSKSKASVERVSIEAIHDEEFPNFCSECSLTLGKKRFYGMTCNDRLEFIISRYGTSKEEAVASMIKDHKECARQ